MSQPAIAGLILSGGASRRMGSPKALLTYRGETFLDRLIRVLGTVCDPVAVVLGHGADAIRAGVQRSALVAVNPDPERGMLSSLQCGLAVLPDSADAAMFLPVDYPAVTEATVGLVARVFAERNAAVTIPVYRGERGHPVCVARAVVRELLALPVTAQARDVIRSYYPVACFVDVDDPGVVRDVDVPEEYRALVGSR
jgi:molybdenum cofactor cytidylyltransferase